MYLFCHSVVTVNLTALAYGHLCKQLPYKKRVFVNLGARLPGHVAMGP